MRKAILCLLFLSVLCLSAQTVYKLDSCKAMAKENNLALQNKKLEIERARQTQKEVFTKYFPTVSAIGVGFKMSDYMVDMDYGLGTVKLPFFNYILPSIQLPSIPMQMLDGGLMGGVTAVQPVFAGLRIVRGNQLAKLGVQAAELQAQMSENEVDAMVENYYWQIVALQEKLRTIETLDKQLARVSEDVDAAVGAGVVNRNSQLQVQLKRQELLSGKVRVQNGIRTYKLLLKQYAQIPEADFEIAADTLLMPDPPTIYYVEASEGVSWRVESQLLDLQVNAAEKQTQMEIGKNLPQVAVGAGYSAYYMNVNADNTANNHFGMVFGTVTVPITDWWGGGHAIKKSRLAEQIARNERESNRQLLAVQTQQNWNELDEAYNQLLISQKSIDLAKENLRMQQDYFDAGTATLSNLLDAQSMYQQSMDGFTEAYVNYQVKKCTYLQNTGR